MATCKYSFVWANHIEKVSGRASEVVPVRLVMLVALEVLRKVYKSHSLPRAHLNSVVSTRLAEVQTINPHK